jgi:uncharacterized membrane protein
MESILTFLGRFHPLLVHLPIGILFLAFLFEVLAQKKRYKKLRLAVQPMLLWGTLFAIASAITGYLLSLEGGYETSTLTWHQNAGIATALFAIIFYFARKNRWILAFEKNRRVPIRVLLFIPLIILLTATGHLGGSLTHGEDFLTGAALFTSPEVEDPLAKVQLITNIDETVLYDDVIQPILESKCYDCHSSKKQKGELRLDTRELIVKGGKHGLIISEGLADSTELLKRLMLPLEDEHHMPPNEKPQLSAVEIDLIRLWISEGAGFEEKVKDLSEGAQASRFIKLLIENNTQQSWIPTENVSAVSEKAIQGLKADGVLVQPVASDNNYVSVSYINARTPINEDLRRLLPLKDQLVSLRLSYCNISHQDLSVLKEFGNLTWLYLDNSDVTDDSFRNISTLPKLKYLNLANTAVTDHSVDIIAGMKELKQIYLYQTKISEGALEKLSSKIPALKINVGQYTLPKLASDTIIYMRENI